MSQATVADHCRKFGEWSRNLTGTRVLVAEDSRVARVVIDDILTAEGCETRHVSCVEDLSEKVHSFAPQVIVLSHWLSGRDTLQLIEAWQRDSSVSTPVILALASDALAEGIRSINAGAFDCLYKPLQPADVMVRVYRALVQSQPGSAFVNMCTPPHVADADYEKELLEPLMNVLESQFLALITVELRQPLEALLAFSQSVQSQKDLANIQKTLEVLRNFITAAKRLIASAGPSELFSTLEVDIREGWKRRIDRPGRSVAIPHVAIGSNLAHERRVPQPAANADKRVS